MPVVVPFSDSPGLRSDANSYSGQGDSICGTLALLLSREYNQSLLAELVYDAVRIMTTTGNKTKQADFYLYFELK
nr:hypothetical protein [Tanacetum cinerariifolium]